MEAVGFIAGQKTRSPALFRLQCLVMVDSSMTPSMHCRVISADLMLFHAPCRQATPDGISSS